MPRSPLQLKKSFSFKFHFWIFGRLSQNPFFSKCNFYCQLFVTHLLIDKNQNDITRDGGAAGVPLQNKNWNILLHYWDLSYSDCHTWTVGLHNTSNLGRDYALYVLFILLLFVFVYWKLVGWFDFDWIRETVSVFFYIIIILSVCCCPDPHHSEGIDGGGTIAIGFPSVRMSVTAIFSITARWNWLKFGTQYPNRYISRRFFWFFDICCGVRFMRQNTLS